MSVPVTLSPPPHGGEGLCAAVRTPGPHFARPLRAANTPVLAINTPVLTANTPVPAINTPVLIVNTPVLVTNTPVLAINTPVLITNTPVLAANTPVPAARKFLRRLRSKLKQSPQGRKRSTRCPFSCPNVYWPPFSFLPLCALRALRRPVGNLKVALRLYGTGPSARGSCHI
jgi:hypothetical protein